MQTMVQTVPLSGKAKAGSEVWIGRAISGLVVAFMLFDGAGKVAGEAHVVRAMAELGWPRGQMAGLGVCVLACAALYLIPRTSILGAILLTGFLGGATAAKVRIEDPSLLFSVAVGALAWAGLYLRDARLRTLLPLKRKEEPR